MRDYESPRQDGGGHEARETLGSFPAARVSIRELASSRFFRLFTRQPCERIGDESTGFEPRVELCHVQHSGNILIVLYHKSWGHEEKPSIF